MFNNGYSAVLLPLLHNYYFAGSLALFTRAESHFLISISDYIYAIKDLFILNFNSEIFTKVYFQVSEWNPLYNLHRLIILLIISYFIIFYRQKIFIYTLFLVIISQHGVLLLTHASSRYAYLAWFLTTILFIKIEFDNQIFKKSYDNLFKKKLK